MPKLKPAEICSLDFFEPDARVVLPTRGETSLSQKIINDCNKEAIKFSGFEDFYMPSYMQDDDRNLVFPKNAKWKLHIASRTEDDEIHTSVQPANGLSPCQAGTCNLCRIDDQLTAYEDQLLRNELSQMIREATGHTLVWGSDEQKEQARLDRIHEEARIGDEAEFYHERLRDEGYYDNPPIMFR